MTRRRLAASRYGVRLITEAVEAVGVIDYLGDAEVDEEVCEANLEERQLGIRG
jgi:hypothetical protein